MQKCLKLAIKRWKFVWRARIYSYEYALGQSWWELARNHPASTGKRPFHFDNFSSLTTLCEHYITRNVYKTMTSWRRKLPRINQATCLRKEYFGSFNVLNHWLCGPCKSHMRIKTSQYEISEPVDISRRSEIDSMDWWRDVPDDKTLGKLVVATLYIYPIEYNMRRSRRS